MKAGALSDKAPMLELTYTWDPEDYGAARNFGRFDLLVDDIDATSARLKETGVTMKLPPQELWASMPKAGPR